MTNFWVVWVQTCVYVTQFWSVVVVNCVNPANIGGCIRVDQWLVPAIGDVIRFNKQR